MFQKTIFLLSALCGAYPGMVHERQPLAQTSEYTINFNDVPVVEFIQFVSRISDMNFIFDHKDLQFNITLSSGKPASPDQVVKALVQVLRAHGFFIGKEDGYLVIHKGGEDSFLQRAYEKSQDPSNSPFQTDQLISSLQSLSGLSSEPRSNSTPQFLVYKLQYHDGLEIEESVKKIAADLATKSATSPQYLNALKSVQWVKSTNSLVCSGDESTLSSIKQLFQSLDAPLRQVFIELLVVEVDNRHTVDFGLQWAAGGSLDGKVGFGTGNFPPTASAGPFATAFQGINALSTPKGPSQIPLGNGFDMGVIGDIIFHKGKSFLSLGSLVSALQVDGDSSIVLNQKIITQDNKKSTIFVGDNIPFTGSIVQTVGTSQQTTANIEYRDIGVNLTITPKLGEGDVITLDLQEEITEAVQTGLESVSTAQVTGIQTTKTNMMTHVHVPDKHFLVLSGMIRNAKRFQKAGVPCLGGLPVIGAAFSKTKNKDEKRNIMIFVRPHIIRSVEDYRKLSDHQESLYSELTSKKLMEEARALVE
ncbi:hypothetical protein [Rhabdochlamydiaceae symbiont of Dictyostelium giganteum]|uniref:hypothetical protein n=1 Tax=Rhabdochlamydiaceae symbiont of Dictyostelium giganteum TaxID=3342349 RepID=UPI00384B4DEF